MYVAINVSINVKYLRIPTYISSNSLRAKSQPQ